MGAASHSEPEFILEQAGFPADGTTVAVVITTFNQARFLGEAIMSVLAQTRQADTIIIVDDGSSDDPASVAAQKGSTDSTGQSWPISGAQRKVFVTARRATSSFSTQTIACCQRRSKRAWFTLQADPTAPSSRTRCRPYLGPTL